MKKKSLIGAVLCLLVILLTGCTSTVNISYMKPSRVNMGPYRNIAVASTRDSSSFAEPPFFIKMADKTSAEKFGNVFSSYSGELSKAVAKDATGKLMGVLKGTGFFSILGPSDTDDILEKGHWFASRKELFMKRGVDAVIIPKIETMNAAEWISSKSWVREVKKEDGSVVKENAYEYYYEYDISLRWSYTVIDVESEKIVARNSFTGRHADRVKIDTRSFIPSGFRPEFSSMLDEMMREVRKDLVPSRESMTVSLMKDKTGNRNAELAYEYLDDGRYLTALDMLLDVWYSDRSVPAGYNASLLLAGLGRFEEAVNLLDDVVRCGGGSDAVWLRREILRAWKSDSETVEMLEEKKPTGITGLDIYDTVGV